MSMSYLNWAFDRHIKPSTLKFVLVAMSDFANEYGEAYPSIQTLCNKTGQNKKTVMENIKRLIEHGLISDTGDRKGKTQQVKVFKLHMVELPSYKETNDKPVKLKSTENGTVPKTDHKSTEKGSLKEYQKRYTEPSVIITTSKPSDNLSAKASDSQKIFEYWKKTHSKMKSTKLSDNRSRKIKWALKYYTPKEICLAIKGCTKSDWHMGGNPQGVKYNDLTNILKDDAVIERFIEYTNGKPNVKSLKLPQDDKHLKQWAESNGAPKAEAGDTYELWRHKLSRWIKEQAA